MADTSSSASLSGREPATVGAASPLEIGRLEELGRRGWPPIEVEEVDGWLLGLSGRYTRRANSVAPVVDGALPVDERIRRVEAAYGRRACPAIFKLQAAAEPADLDRELDARGYARTSETIVMTRPSSAPLAVDDDPEVRVVGGHLEADWFEASVELSGVAPALRDDYRALLDHAIATTRVALFGRLERDGQILSLALGCVVEGAVSLVQVATAVDVRGLHLAERVLHGILARAGERGEPTPLLSVEAENTSARRLYTRIGFSERYRYWYREQPPA